MSILTKSPLRGLRPGGYQSILDRLFRNDLRDYFMADFPETVPAVNISEEKDRYVIEMAAPGLKKEDFKVNVQNDEITIACEKEEEKKEEGKHYSRREYNYSSFTRSFTLPDDANINNIEARYTDGVLKLTVSKKDSVPAKQAKQIPVS